jgi:tRNA (adenine22-N1)-methyltransferase
MLPPLGPRLAAVARHVLPGLGMADIGTDHAYLPASLVDGGVCPCAIAGDVRPGPLAQARATLAAAGRPLAVELRLGDGLQVLRPGEVATVTLCGMGGPLIVELLTAAPSGVLAPGVRVVAQPMQGEHVLRRWLYDQGWRFVGEELVAEEGRIYPIVVAEVPVALGGEAGGMGVAPEGADRGLGGDGWPGREWTDADTWVGPILRHSRDPLLPAYLDGHIERLQRAMAQLAGARGEAGQQRQAELAQQLATLQAERAAALERLAVRFPAL